MDLDNRSVIKVTHAVEIRFLKTEYYFLLWNQWRSSGVFIANFKQISYLFLMFLMFSLSR